MLRAARSSEGQGGEARQPLHPGRQPRGRGRRRGDRRRQRARGAGAALRRQVLLGDRPKVPLEERLPKLEEHRLPREARHAVRAGGAHRGARARAGADRRRRSRAGRARGAPRQGRSRHRDGRRVPRAAGPDGPLLRGAAGRGPSGRRAIEEHYKPLGPSDRVPTDPVSVAVALADKLDTLVGFWAIDEKPTGSKDPYALRARACGARRHPHRARERAASCRRASSKLLEITTRIVARIMDGDAGSRNLARSSLLAFFADRLKVHLRDQGARHDLIDAVLRARARTIS